MIQLNRNGETRFVNPDAIAYIRPANAKQGGTFIYLNFAVGGGEDMDAHYQVVDEDVHEIADKVFQWERLKRGI